jgi:excisionase family DNA binding protein
MENTHMPKRNGKGPGPAVPPADGGPAAAAPADLIPMAEAARLLPSNRPGKRLHVATLYRWLFSGRLRGWKIGRHYHVSRAEVLRMAEPVEVAQPAPRQQRRRQYGGDGYQEAVDWLRAHGVK